MREEAVTVPLGSVTTWLSGGTPNRANSAYWAGPVPWISAATLKRTRIYDSDQHITEAAVRVGSKLAPRKSTLVLVRGMALHHEIRVGLAMRPVSFNQDVKALVPRQGVLPAYLTYSLHARRGQILELTSSAGSGTGVLDVDLLKRLPIWLPGVSEQEDIIQIVDDVDAMIGVLERAIAKKRAIKQGMMQQLLTGRSRLLGFTDPWQLASIGELLEFKNGLNKASQYFGSGTPIVNFMDIMNGPVVTSRDVSGRVTLTRDEIERFSAKRNDIFFTRTSETVDEVGTAAVLADDIPNATFSGFILRGRPRTDTSDSRFIAYSFQLDDIRKQIIASATYTTRALTNGRSLSGLTVGIPSLDEQRAIADVIADGYAEITALRIRLIKAQAVKTGMLQNLLTGRIRLPV